MTQLNQMNQVLQIQATQWSELPDVDDVRPISEHDSACLRDLRDVLVQHGALARFGISLLHTHFPVGQDEIMLETTDETTRTQTVAPVHIGDGINLPGKTMLITQLRLCEGDMIATVGCGCLRDKNGHTGRGHR